MTVKESSDELNPAVLTRAMIAPTRGRRTLLDYVALGVATCGVGLLPLAPGTWGSLVGVALYLGARALSLQLLASATAQGWHGAQLASLQTTCVVGSLLALTFIGIWAATRAESLPGRKDPGAVVIDEVVGQLIAYTFVPYGGWWMIIVGFLAFRAFDIWKPYPIRRLERLESGLGIMADDVLAGCYAAALLSLLTAIYLLF